jgi:hypothetical protein
MIEGAWRDAAVLCDYDLDVRVAEVVARREVASAYGQAQTAARWHELLIRLVDLREMRVEAAREIEALTGAAAPVSITAAVIESDDDEPIL